MRSITAIIIVTLGLIVSASAQTNDYLSTIKGKWIGTLEYQDYTTGKRVAMKTAITVVPAADGKSAEFQTIYDDFGKIYRSSDAVRIDAEARKFVDGKTEYGIESNEPGKIVLIGVTRDGDNDEPTRKTITYAADTLTILKETRTPWQFRNSYTLRRVREFAPVTLTPEQMSADLALLRTTLEAIHPGVYRYLSKASLAGIFDEAGRRIRTPLAESEFLIIVSQLLSQLKCGHTYVNPYNQDGGLKSRLFGARTYLPFYFRIVDGKFVVTANASSKRLAVGSEILSINDVPVAEIVAKLLTVTRADGRSTMAHRVDQIGLSRNEAESFALFDWYFPLFFPIKDGVLNIEARDFASGKIVRFGVLAAEKQERTDAIANRFGPTPTYDDGWKFEIRSDGIGYLKIDNSITWRLKTIKFKEFLAAAFAELRTKNVADLVIDLRGNGGGSMDPGFELSRYLADRKLAPYAASRRLVRNVSARPDLVPFLDTYSDDLLTALKAGTPSASYRKFSRDYFEILGRESYPAVEPYADRFRGRTFVIADSSNASATFQFLDYAKKNRLATIVGQPTGGNQQGINGGAYYFLRMPNSKIEVDIPVFFQSPLTPQPDAPVFPDVEVKRSADDVGRGVDRELETIIGLINDRDPQSKKR